MQAIWALGVNPVISTGMVMRMSMVIMVLMMMIVMKMMMVIRGDRVPKF